MYVFVIIGRFIFLGTQWSQRKNSGKETCFEPKYFKKLHIFYGLWMCLDRCQYYYYTTIILNFKLMLSESGPNGPILCWNILTIF